MSKVVIIRDEKHPLLEQIERYAKKQGVKIDTVYWKETTLYNFKDTTVVFMDRMGELYNTYETQIIWLNEMLNDMNIQIVNDPQIYFWMRNKILSYIKFTEMGFDIPKSIVITNKRQLETLSSGKYIAKPYLGTCSDGVIPFTAKNVSEDVIDMLKRDGMILVQEFITNPDRYIWRVDVVNGEIVQINQRYAYNCDEQFQICNGTYGGKINVISPMDTPKDVRNFINSIYEKIGLEIMGVDFLIDENQKLWLLEINPEPDITCDFKGFPNKIADYLISLM